MYRERKRKRKTDNQTDRQTDRAIKTRRAHTREVKSETGSVRGTTRGGVAPVFFAVQPEKEPRRGVPNQLLLPSAHIPMCTKNTQNTQNTRVSSCSVFRA